MPFGRLGVAVSHMSQAYPERVDVRGRDLCGDLIGRLSFTEYFHLLLTGYSILGPSGFWSWRMSAVSAERTCCWHAAFATVSRRRGEGR
ncbi:MAG: hypothetical protein ACLP01_03950 [Solirubrobacteraceae bacterium]